MGNNRLIAFMGNETLAGYLIGNLKLTPIRAGMLALAWGWFTSLMYAILSNTLLPNGKFLTLTEDYTYIITETGILLLVWGYYIWTIRAPVEVLQELEDTKVVSIDDARLKDAAQPFQTKAHEIVAAVIAGLVTIVYATGLKNSQLQWLNYVPAFIVLRSLLVVLPSVFAGVLIIYRLFINAQIFRTILKDVDLHPLHPDRAGGLSSLGRYSLSTTYLVAIAGCLGAILEYEAYKSNTLSNAYFAHVVILVYLILAPISFFIPLSAAHESMRRAKNKLILQISQQFNQEFLTIPETFAKPSNDLKESVGRIEQLQALHKIAESFPVWPFDIDTIRRFAITISSPILTIAISVLIDYVKGLLSGNP